MLAPGLHHHQARLSRFRVVTGSAEPLDIERPCVIGMVGLDSTESGAPAAAVRSHEPAGCDGVGDRHTGGAARISRCSILSHNRVYQDSRAKEDRPMRRHVAASAAFYVGVLALLALAIAGSGCTGANRESTIRAALVTVDASRSAYVAYDQHEQEQIVAKATSLEDGKTKLAAYRAKRERAVKAFVVAYQAIATGEQLNDDHSLASVASAVLEVIAAVKDLTGGKP